MSTQPAPITPSPPSMGYWKAFRTELHDKRSVGQLMVGIAAIILIVGLLTGKHSHPLTFNLNVSPSTWCLFVAHVVGGMTGVVSILDLIARTCERRNGSLGRCLRSIYFTKM